MTQQGPTTRVRARLRSRQALRDAMDYQRLTVRELSVACGRPSYRSTIGHLHSGDRLTCSPHLARRIEEALRLYPGALFELVVTSGEATTTDPKVLTRGRQKAA